MSTNDIRTLITQANAANAAIEQKVRKDLEDYVSLYKQGGDALAAIGQALASDTYDGSPSKVYGIVNGEGSKLPALKFSAPTASRMVAMHLFHTTARLRRFMAQDDVTMTFVNYATWVRADAAGTTVTSTNDAIIARYADTAWQRVDCSTLSDDEITGLLADLRLERDYRKALADTGRRSSVKHTATVADIPTLVVETDDDEDVTV